MKIKKIISTIAIVLGIADIAHAVPAYRGPITQIAEDGTEQTIFLFGDEHYHWSSTTPDAPCPISEQERITMPRRIIAEQKMAIDLNIAPRGLVILVNFKNKEFSTADREEMDQMLNGENYHREYDYTSSQEQIHVVADGSARQYYIDQSMGQYKPHFDVVGPYKVAKDFTYYGKNDASDQEPNVPEMIYEACCLADADGVDFSLYDNDEDGIVDFVYVIYAGYGEADGGSTSTIWPHTYWMSYTSYKNALFDGKKIDTYACANEIEYASKQHCGVGTFVHEFSHVLGLMDLYTTNNANHKTMGAWDIMDYGPYNNSGNTPPAYSAYERFFLGWLKPTLLTKAGASVTLHELQTNNVAAVISETDVFNMIGNDPSPTTFYMLENRQQKGWDQYIPGHGLMLTKIKYSYTKWNSNTINNTKTNMGVDLIEADGSAPNSNHGKASDLFPEGSTKYTNIPGHGISNITETDGVISFDINNGGGEIIITDINELQASPVAAGKHLIDGQIVIIRDNKLYNLAGQVTGNR